MSVENIFSEEEIKYLKIKINDYEKGKIKYSDLRYIIWDYLNLACERITLK